MESDDCNCQSLFVCCVNHLYIYIYIYIIYIYIYIKAKITGQTGNNRRIDDVEIIVPLKYLSNF